MKENHGIPVGGKFQVGDKVKVVNYGHLIFGKYTEVGGKLIYSNEAWDLAPEKIGKTGIIIESKNDLFGIHFENGSEWWYEADQLEKILS